MHTVAVLALDRVLPFDLSTPVEMIAGQVGFGSANTFRDRFRRLVGTSPHAYRRAFKGSSSG